MEAKIFGMLMVFALIVAGAAWTLNITSTNELDSRVMDAKAALRGVDSTIEHLTGSVETLARSTKRLKDLAEKEVGLEKKLEEVHQQIASANADAISFDARHTALVEEERTNAAGAVLPEIKLKSGRVMTSVRIQRATAEVLSVQYAEGSAHLLKKDLPDELAARFEMVDSAPSAPPPPKPKDTTAATTAKIRELRESLSSFNAKLALAQSNLALWQAREADYRARYQSARTAGRSSSIVNLTDAEAAVLAGSRQVNSLKAQVDQLEHELAPLVDGQR